MGSEMCIRDRSGNVRSMVSDGTKIWIATESPNGGGQGSAGILQGAFNSSGGIDWEEGWSLPFFTTIQDMLLDGTNIYVSTSGSGLFTLNTTTGSLLRESGSIHNSLGTSQFITPFDFYRFCLLYTSPSPRDATLSRMPSSA